MEKREIVTVKTLEKITALFGESAVGFLGVFDVVLIAPASTLVFGELAQAKDACASIRYYI
ncbi:hypothetical protein [Aggregatibacter kilianii]|uniref:hypothetical protein n=1 Tax=Aggregatibacter kilianii TaxID=2025884 RepID=UPI0013A6785B|nr:hypothetical protein [Aggregatibacter kilianii]